MLTAQCTHTSEQNDILRLGSGNNSSSNGLHWQRVITTKDTSLTSFDAFPLFICPFIFLSASFTRLKPEFRRWMRASVDRSAAASAAVTAFQFEELYVCVCVYGRNFVAISEGKLILMKTEREREVLAATTGQCCPPAGSTPCARSSFDCLFESPYMLSIDRHWPVCAAQAAYSSRTEETMMPTEMMARDLSSLAPLLASSPEAARLAKVVEIVVVVVVVVIAVIVFVE